MLGKLISHEWAVSVSALNASNYWPVLLLWIPIDSWSVRCIRGWGVRPCVYMFCSAPGTSPGCPQQVVSLLAPSLPLLTQHPQTSSDNSKECSQRHSNQPSDHITGKLSQKIRELGHKTAELELRVDDLDIRTHNHSDELSEWIIWLDFENRARRSNVHIRRLLELIVDV